MAAFAAVLSLIIVVRHTREEEETGRQEMLSAAMVGRRAPLTSALLVALLANTGIALLTTLGLAKEGAGGALAMGLGIGGVGMVFATMAAMVAQLTETARLAKGLTAGARRRGLRAARRRRLGDRRRLAPPDLALTDRLGGEPAALRGRALVGGVPVHRRDRGAGGHRILPRRAPRHRHELPAGPPRARRGPAGQRGRPRPGGCSAAACSAGASASCSPA